jgi:hypothetical protein
VARWVRSRPSLAARRPARFGPFPRSNFRVRTSWRAHHARHDAAPAVAAARQMALDLAYVAHPERFTHGAPRVALPPSAVHINPWCPES